MAKLLEKNCAEMATALISLCGPIRNFLEDEEFMEAFREKTKDGIKSRISDVLKVYIDLTPLLIGEKHLPDTLMILATVEGKDPKEMLLMNGTDVLADALLTWHAQIGPFFTRLGLTV